MTPRNLNAIGEKVVADFPPEQLGHIATGDALGDLAEQLAEPATGESDPLLVAVPLADDSGIGIVHQAGRWVLPKLDSAVVRRP